MEIKKEIPKNITQLVKNANNKNSWKMRLDALNELRQFDCKQSRDVIIRLAIHDKVFKVKKGITQITFEGDFIEGGAVVQATWDDVSDEIKDLVECGVYTEEEALARCSSNGGKQQRMVLRKPMVRLVGEEKTPVLQKFEERYTEEDLVLDYLYISNDKVAKADEEDEEEVENGVDDMSWLNELQ